MEVVECTPDRFVFQEETEQFQTDDRIAQRLMRFGCFLPLAVSSAVFMIVALYETAVGDMERVFPSLFFAALTGAIGWGGHRYLRARIRKGKGGFRYTFARKRKPIVEVHSPRGDLQPHSAMELDDDSYLRCRRLKDRPQRSGIPQDDYQAILVGAEGVEYRMESPGLSPMSLCLTKLLNISRVTGLSIKFGSSTYSREPVEEWSLPEHPDGFRFESQKSNGRFEYRIAPSLKRVSTPTWLLLGGLLGLSFILARAVLETSFKAVWVSALLGTSLWLIYYLALRVSARESLVVDGNGVVFRVNGKEQTRRELSDLIEVQVLPEGPGPYSLWAVGLFFPGHTAVLLARYGLLLKDAKQVALDIRSVLQEHALAVPEGQFGSRFYEC